MDLKNKNIVNIFTPSEINHQSLVLFMFAFLPAAFITHTIEATLVYLLLTFIFLTLNSFATKLINITVDSDLKFLIVPITAIGLTILVSLFSKAVFVNYSKEYNIYTYLMAVGSLPYLLATDNRDLSISKGIVSTVQSFIGFSLVMLIIALFREVFGMGVITFGKYTTINFELKILGKYIIPTLQRPYGVLIILGLIAAIVNGRSEEVWHI